MYVVSIYPDAPVAAVLAVLLELLIATQVLLVVNVYR